MPFIWAKPLCCFLVMWSIFGYYSKAQVAPAQPAGHAHNDYEKARKPLIAALRKGYTSIEIDIFPFRSTQLKVAHLPLFLSLAKDLESLYFVPLEAWLSQYGTIFESPDQPLIFMIDIKKSPTKSYRLLRQLCLRYSHLIEHYLPSKDSMIKGPLKIILSGRKPYQDVLQDSIQFMALDGSPDKIQDPRYSAWIMPRISLPYYRFLKWRGHRAIAASELNKLKDFISKVHISGRKLRFWALPGNKNIWKLLLDEGIDWIQVDHLDKFNFFYQGYRSSKMNE